MRNQPIDVEPLIALAALARLIDKLSPWKLKARSMFGEQKLPHVENCARRLFLAARQVDVSDASATDSLTGQKAWTAAFETIRSALAQKIADNTWDVPPLSRFELIDTCDTMGPTNGIYQAMMYCALRFDGYRYRKCVPGKDGVAYSLSITDRLEQYADYEYHCPFDLLTSFFLVQRALGGRGSERSDKTAPVRRVFRELFVVTHDIYVPRKWATFGVDPAYYLWRWAYHPVAPPLRRSSPRRPEHHRLPGPASRYLKPCR